MSSLQTLPNASNSAPSDLLTQQRMLVGVGLSSFAALLLELSLTRLFSVVLFYHFAFLAISIALLGLGTGGVFAHLMKRRLASTDIGLIAAACAGATALVVPAALQVVLHVPVSLNLSGGNFLRLTAIYTVCAAPFFLTGVQLSVVFARMPASIGRLYGADLAGGALACIATVPLLNWVGAPNAILCSAIVAAVAAFIWAPGTKRRWTVALALFLLAVLAANRSGRIADIVWAKGIRRQNAEFARWNAISRVEVDRQRDGARVIVIDADANTFIMNADPGKWQGSPWQARLMSSPPAVVNVLRPRGEYAIIGPGGGVDVLRAVANGSVSVTGIEINPIIATDIMRRRYADFDYHLYEGPDVHIQVGDGRSFIRKATQTFDVVQMTLVDTWASTAAGAFALTENNLYTTEAFREYFDHLKPDGIIAVTRWEFAQPREALRVVSVAMNALHQLGVADPGAHFIVVSQSQLNEDGINVAVLAKKSAFTPEEVQSVVRHVAANFPMQLLYAPSAHQENAFAQLIKSNDPYSFSKSYAYNVRPVNDDAPFFFFTLKPGRIFQGGTGRSMDWKVNLGFAVLLMLLVISIAAVLVFLIAPLALGSPERSVHGLFYFIAIGLGYILVEVTFIQRFVLFLGHPTYALTVVIFLMLLASGTGSLVSRNWPVCRKNILAPLLVIVSVLATYIAVLPRTLELFVGAPVAAKILISAGLLVPLGFAMGIPFPTGLRALASGRQSSIEWAWAMNAASSVLGSVLAIVIAILFGLNVTLACGAAAYVLALLFHNALRSSFSLS